MGLYPITCIGCEKPFLWYSGNVGNQLCVDCNSKSQKSLRSVIVTGGRDYNDYVMVCYILGILNIDLIIQGGAWGTDKLALEFAKANNIECKTIKADWTKHGKAAGLIRNKEMLESYPDAIVVAFPGGRGTANCVRQALERNMVVLEVKK